MNTESKITKKERNPRISAATLMRLAGFSAMLAGLGVVAMGMFHPANEPAFVTTPTWIIVHIFATSLGFFGVLGLAGLYARQVENAIATFRARILPRWAAGVLALGTLMVPFGPLVPTEVAAKIIMVPMGLGLAWMGYALLTERQEKSAETMIDQKTVQPVTSKAA